MAIGPTTGTATNVAITATIVAVIVTATAATIGVANGTDAAVSGTTGKDPKGRPHHAVTWFG